MFLPREIKQTRIEAQTGNDAGVLSDCGKEFKRREGAIGDNDDRATWEPTTYLQNCLPRAVDQRLG
jgi:hypothetical protein